MPQLYTQIHRGIRGWLNYYTKPFSDQPECLCGLENVDEKKDGTEESEDFPEKFSNATSSRDYIDSGTRVKKHQYPWEVSLYFEIFL